MTLASFRFIPKTSLVRLRWGRKVWCSPNSFRAAEVDRDTDNVSLFQPNDDKEEMFNMSLLQDD